MKIAFFICTIKKDNPGLGGHFFSLLETLNQLSENHEVFIINIGVKKAVSLDKSPYKTYNVIEQKPRLFIIHKAVKNIIEDENPDILHSFDSIAYFWSRTVSFMLKIPCSITKCGGVNNKFFPYTKHLVLFSKENELFFKQRKKFKKTNTYLIPNRISEFQDDKFRIGVIEDKLEDRNLDFKFLRISRIGPDYQKSALQLVSLVNKLNEDGIKCCFIYVGVVEDKKCFDELKSLSKGNGFFFTEKEMTNNAKEVLSVADAVLGTGRSFMEAACKAKILLSPIKGSTIPLLIGRGNFQTAFKYNFSERIFVENYNEDKNYNNIRKVINDGEEEKYGEFSKALFKEWFDASKIPDIYEVMFKNMGYSNTYKILDFFLHGLYVLRALIKK